MDKTEFGSSAYLIPIPNAVRGKYTLRKRQKNTVTFFKFIQLITLVICAVFFSISVHREVHAFRLALSYATFGAYFVISLSAIFNYFLNEPLPNLMVQMIYNLAGAVLFILIGWYLQDQLDVASRNTDLSEFNHESNMNLLAGMVSISNGVFYLVEANFSILFYIMNL